MGIIGSSLILITYFVGYAVIHSWLAGVAVKDWVNRRFGPAARRGYRLAYNLFAIISLLPMLALMVWLPDVTLYIVPAPWRWLMVAGQLLALLAAAWSLWQTDLFYFVGLRQLIDKEPAPSGSLQVEGFYRWMRHPLYSFSLVFLWLMPVMTANMLTTWLLLTLYFYIGSIYEERRLVDEFGVAYERYRQQVPRFIPRPSRHYAPQVGEAK
jgi:protein-S-isoprenylcysteine O-methyltransferase Ste14